MAGLREIAWGPELMGTRDMEIIGIVVSSFFAGISGSQANFNADEWVLAQSRRCHSPSETLPEVLGAKKLDDKENMRRI